MKVIVKLEIEVDPAEWYETYGTGNTPAVVREEVKSYAFHSLQQLCEYNNGARVTNRS